ncbi:TraB/GumN family protein [Marinimicrobium sp. C6131]|uniref:TraB/GumN family protein n=1 Tax=Marinimicrobium sp. C6131 TaxID=3022676 RepID=UPI00223D4790|nr:TraB/GumN family protein [Marinimicrobium sp. C6131]UZJ43666.1 TraB/GumN family protein [Marinimicrobium sp. C6131]
MFFRLIHTLLLSAALVAVSVARADTTLYTVSKGDQSFFLGGTIHLLHPDDFPLPEEFDAAYAEADALYLETDLGVMQDPAFGQKMMQVMMYPPGKTLNTELSPEVWKALQEYSQAHQFPVQQFMGFDPAFVSMIMTVMLAQQNGIQQGVDAYFYQKAQRDGLPLGELETAEQVLDYMKVMAGHDGDAIIQATLTDLKRFDELMTEMVDAWRTGDLETLDREMGQPMREQAPGMYRTLLTERNHDWLPVLESLFEQAGTELVLVGSLHLAGDDGLLNTLEQKGYEVTPYALSANQ